MRIAVRMPGQGAPVAAVPAAPQAQAAPVAAVPAPAAEEPASDRPATWKPVVAPMVGTYYEAPAPGEPPFVKVGDEVAAVLAEGDAAQRKDIIFLEPLPLFLH